MRLIAHRGISPVLYGPGSNTLADLERAFRNEADVEIDVRLHGTTIYCSHDPMQLNDECEPLDPTPMFMEFCALLAKFPKSRAFVNVKCDGMTPQIHDTAGIVLNRIVTFDHSMPDFLIAEERARSGQQEYMVQRARRSSPWESPVFIHQMPLPWIWLDPIGILPKDMPGFIERRLHEHEHSHSLSPIVVVSPDVHSKTFDPRAMQRLVAILNANPQVYGVLTDTPQDFGFRVVA